VLIACLAACWHPSASQVATHAAAASPDAIPPEDLGTVELPGSCMITYRGWSANGCTPIDSITARQTIRQVSITRRGALYAVTTSNPQGSYTVQLGANQTHARNSPACDPVQGTCVKHAWTLGPSSLELTTTSLHDNSSPTPLPQCSEHYYRQEECSFVLSW
jgi:hypothetical protein